MSGTSLDGLDLAHCIFQEENGVWEFEITAAETIAYDQSWKEILRKAPTMSGLELAQLNVDFGIFCGKQAKRFIQDHELFIDAIASHGHTIFHQPHESLTLQIGSGAHLAVHAGFKTICDFRSTDVALQGQGAPLVPIGDRLLFNDYDFRLNIGGIANVSYSFMNELHAFDICIANMALNTLAEQAGQAFDANGEMARRGQVNLSLLEKLNALPYYSLDIPKSLGKENFDQDYLPLLLNSQLPIRDLLATCTEHTAIQITNVFDGWNGRVLITGGGALNTYLIERINHYSSLDVVVPDMKTIQFKESLIFALLGALRLREEPTALAEVTGALKDNSGGCIYLP